jgi:phosphatidylserine/phosphatidylglycerophosphate/cardiolipin synthase-like enzyme
VNLREQLYRNMNDYLVIILYLLLAAPLYAQTFPGVAVGKAPMIIGHTERGNVHVGASSCHVEAVFSPNGGAAARVAMEIGAAKQNILVAMYSLTNSRIADALIAAAQRGVKVQIILDSGQAIGNTEKAQLNKLRKAKIAYQISTLSRTLHDKYTVIDNAKVLTGSFNWSNLADCCNAENMVVISGCQEVVASYAENWTTLK